MSEKRDSVEEAVRRGHIIVRPESNELFIDIDTPEQEGRFCRGLVFLREAKALKDYVLRESPSGKDNHKHGVVTLNREVHGEYERGLLQCLLGSDLTRKGFSWTQLQAGESCPTLFFEKPAVENNKEVSHGSEETVSTRA